MIFNRFFRRESARRPKTSTRCYKTLPRRPKTSQDAPKTRPRRHKTAQEHPKTPPRGGPGRARSGKNWDRKAISTGTPSKPRFYSVLGWIWAGFWVVLGGSRDRFFLDLRGDRSRAQGSQNLSKAARCRPRGNASEPRSGVARCSRSRAKGSLNLPSHLIVRQFKTRQQRASKSNLFLR